MEICYAAVTVTGNIRTENQDAVLIDGFVSAGEGAYTSTGSVGPTSDPAVFGVFDGMGGHAGGGIASRIAAVVVGAPPLPRTEADLVERLRRANSLIHEETQLRPELTGMGATAVVVAISADGFVVASIGDSMAFRTLGGSVGELTTPDRMADPRRDGAWLLTAALGPSAQVRPHTDVYPVAGPTRLLLASDGLTDVVAAADIKRIVTGTPAPDKAADQLVFEALGRGGPDNVSVVVVDLA